jgi:hypothetical protein
MKMRINVRHLRECKPALRIVFPADYRQLIAADLQEKNPLLTHADI